MQGADVYEGLRHQAMCSFRSSSSSSDDDDAAADDDIVAVTLARLLRSLARRACVLSQELSFCYSRAFDRASVFISAANR